MNNKQIKNKKRIGLYLGLGISLAAIAAGSTVALVATLSKGNNQNIPENKVLFNAGEGHVFDAKQKTKLVDCTKETALADISASLKVYNEQDTQSSVKDFVGWAYEKDFSGGKIAYDKIITADTKISPKSSIKAVYKATVAAGEGITWKTVSFERGSSADKANITGNTKFNIISGTTLREINCPVCEPKVTGEMKFVGWKKLGDTQQFSKDVPITQDTSFEPIMSAAAKITFVVPEGATIVGLETVTVQENTLFGDINTPVVECTSSDKIFAGWYQDQDYKKMFPSTMQISGDNVKAYAKIVGRTDQSITVVTAQAVTGVTYEGNSEFAIARNAAWNTYNRPIPKAENQKVKGWEYQVGSGEWTTALGDTTFGDVQTAKIRPILESSISDVVITSEFESIPKNQATAITATVLPSTVSQSVTWKLFSDAECKTEITDETKAKVEYTAGTNIGNVTVFDAYDKDTIYVQAASTIDTTKVGSKGFTFANPYVSSADFWVLNETDTSFDKGWYRLENLEAEDMTKKISLFKNGQSTATKSYDRTAFNQKIYVGDKVTSIPANFLRGCSTFNSEIKFTSEDADYQVRIGDNFMRGCAAFAQALDVTNVISVGDNFLLGANAFASPLTFTKVYSIGDNFLLDHSTYNAEISLGTVITRIGTGFLENCSLFNQNLALPASITSIGSHFLFEAKGYGATLTVDCAGSAFDPNFENLSTRDSTATIATPGFNIAGSKKDEVPYNTLDGTTASGGFYRTIIGKEIDQKTKWLNKYTEFLTNNYPTVKDKYKSATFTNSTYKGLTVSRALLENGSSANEPEKFVRFYEAANSRLGLAAVPATVFNTLFEKATEAGVEFTFTISDDNLAAVGTKAGATLYEVSMDKYTFINKAMDKLVNNYDLTINYSESEPAAYTKVEFSYDSTKCDIATILNKTIIVDRNSTFGACTYKPTFTAKTGCTIKGYSADGGTTLINDSYQFTTETQTITVVCESESEVPDLPEYLALSDDGELSVKTAASVPAELEIKSKYKVGGTDIEVKSIAKNAFNGTNLTTVTIPSTLTKISAGGLATTSCLSSLTFEDQTKTWIINGKTEFDPSGKTAVDCAAVYMKNCSYEWKVKGETTLPEYMNYSVTGANEISISANSGKLESFTETLTIQPEYKINGDTYTVTGITTDGFASVTNTTKVVIPDTVTFISTNAFNTEKVTQLDISASYWMDSDLKTIQFVKDATLDAKTYSQNSTKTLTKINELPSYLASSPSTSSEICISMNGKTYSGPESLKIDNYYLVDGQPKAVTAISANGFFNASSLTSVTLPDTLTEIQSNAFYGTGLTSIIIPDSVKTMYINSMPESISSMSFKIGSTWKDSIDKEVTFGEDLESNATNFKKMNGYITKQ